MYVRDEIYIMYCPNCGGDLKRGETCFSDISLTCENCGLIIIDGYIKKVYEHKTWVMWRLSEDDIIGCAKMINLSKEQIEEIDMESVAQYFNKVVEWGGMEGWVEWLKNGIKADLGL